MLVTVCVSVFVDEDATYDRDNGLLRDLETAAAVAKLRDAMQASTANEDAGI